MVLGLGLGDGARAQSGCACQGAPAGTIVVGSMLGGTVVGAPISNGTIVGTPVAGSTVTDGVVVGSPVANGVVSGPVQGGVYPYSYWVAPPGQARGYVPYSDADQFPFHGRAYGNPGDRWSWYYMGGGDSRYLARYYYQLLR
ncbi:hypothetical protein [Aquisphaera giovannonii]|nr:hypothetical protein [Aquisphaera giovannonii]